MFKINTAKSRHLVTLIINKKKTNQYIYNNIKTDTKIGHVTDLINNNDTDNDISIENTGFCSSCTRRTHVPGVLNEQADI